MRRVFQLPPQHTPETNLPPEVEAAYREMRHFRREIEEHRRIIMTTIAELSSNVSRLIDVATSIRNTPAPQPVPTDDPEVEVLNEKIKRAIDVLNGVTSPQPIPADPNAPIVTD